MHDDVDVIAANAVDWALKWRGSTGYATRCLAFVEDAIERSNSLEVFGGDTAADSAQQYGTVDAGIHPPVGSLVFYDAVGPILGTTRNWGHVGLSLVGGAVVHAWDVVRIDHHRAIPYLRPAPGWTAPTFAGWVPLERVLEGSQPATWSTDAVDDAVRMQAERFGAEPSSSGAWQNRAVNERTR